MSDKTPTPKQVRKHYGRIARLRSQLQGALNNAHHYGVIQYEDYNLESPCFSLYECWDRIKQTTEKQLAEAMRKEIYKNG